MILPADGVLFLLTDPGMVTTEKLELKPALRKLFCRSWIIFDEGEDDDDADEDGDRAEGDRSDGDCELRLVAVVVVAVGVARGGVYDGNGVAVDADADGVVDEGASGGAGGGGGNEDSGLAPIEPPRYGLVILLSFLITSEPRCGLVTLLSFLIASEDTFGGLAPVPLEIALVTG
jgi:hypothetical protein